MSSPFTIARDAFAAYAAAVLGVRRSDIMVAPADESARRFIQEDVGQAWAFTAWTAENRYVLGWATPSGTVASLSYNLGVLFQEAGVWSGTLQLPLHELARRLLWALGWQRTLDPASVALRIEPDGSGTFRFEVTGRPLPSSTSGITSFGGAGGGPLDRHRCTATLRRDHAATFTTELLPMSGAEPDPAASSAFAVASAAFHAFAVERLGVAPGLVDMDPFEERGVTVHIRLADAIAFSAVYRHDPTRKVHAWVLPDGTVVTAEQHLGTLLDSLNAWTGRAKATPGMLAERLAWLLTPGLRVLRDGDHDPTLRVTPDGAGTFVFAVGDARQRLLCTVTLHPDRTATFDTTVLPAT